MLPENITREVALQNKAIKLYEASKTIDNLSSLMRDIKPEERLVVMDAVGTMVRDEFPTNIDREHYLATRSPEDMKKDFNIAVVGETIGYDDEGFEIRKAGGMGPQYLDNINKGVNFLQWKWFWLAYSKHEEEFTLFPNGLPEFDWNPKQIEYYIFNCMEPNPDVAKKYITALMWKLESMTEIPEMVKDKLREELNIIADKIKKILDLYKA